MDRTRVDTTEARLYAPLKRSIRSQIGTIAGDLNIHYSDSAKIISSYLSICRQDLLSGHIVRFFGLVTLYPNEVVTYQVKTTALYCKEVSRLVGLPYHTVYTVVTGYLDDLKLGLFRMESATLNRIVTLKPVCSEESAEDVYSIGARSSVTLNRDILDGKGIITGVRAKVSKFLKEDLKRAVESNYENELRVVQG